MSERVQSLVPCAECERGFPLREMHSILNYPGCETTILGFLCPECDEKLRLEEEQDGS